MKIAMLRGVWTIAASCLAAVLFAACGKENSGPGGNAGDGGTGGSAGSGFFVETISQKVVDKIDLLFMIDNSISMADKQAVLKTAVPDLVARLVSPRCVSPDGSESAEVPDPAGACPRGLERQFTPIRNLHVGVITSSLGGHGSAVCDGSAPGMRGEQNNDHGHLIGSRPRFAAELAQYPGARLTDPLGFLDWNPPPGGLQPIGPFSNTFQAMVTAASEFGCGYESQLESVYRFLADPKPYDRLEIKECSPQNSSPCVFEVGIDQTLLSQRKAFLRPNSVVAVVLISDENDCSILHRDQGFYAARATEVEMPRSTSVCASNPNDPCCVSCISATPPGCSPDPQCTANPTTPAELDPPNLRCFNQKRRFGIDFLYPTERYVNALTRRELCTSRDDLDVPSKPGDCKDLDGNGSPDIFPNPLFSDLQATGMLPRDPKMVLLAGIVGVPWQDIQASQSSEGVTYPEQELHYYTAEQLLAEGVWDTILGDPEPPSGGAPVPPRNQLMIESLSQRGGVDGQGVALAPPTAAVLANPVNSHEWGNTRQDDLQYACVFRLAEPRDCASVTGPYPDLKPGCDCEEVRPGDNNPLCQDPETGAYGRTQHFAKAYPGLRQLQVLKGLGNNAVVASICPRNLNDPKTQDYGYRPAVDAIADRLAGVLVGRCAPLALQEGRECTIIEVRPPGNACDPSRHRAPLDAKLEDAVADRLQTAGICGGPGRPECSSLTACELAEAGPECHGVGEQPRPGWCYVDPEQNPDDDPRLVASCPPSERRIFRFVDPDNATPAADAITVLIACDPV